MKKLALVFACSLALVNHGWTQTRAAGVDPEVKAVRERLLGQPDSLRESAKSVRQSGTFPESNEPETSLWVKQAGERLKKLIGKGSLPSRSTSGPSQPELNLGFLNTLVYIILGLGIFIALYFVFRDYKFGGRRKGVRPLIESDEPERSADEWLLLGEEHEQAGRYRDAVRAFFLATLIRMGERGVLRFRRWETNWEHLQRYEQAPQFDIPLRDMTLRFDAIWYGGGVATAEDSGRYKRYYVETIAKMSKGAI